VDTGKGAAVSVGDIVAVEEGPEVISAVFPDDATVGVYTGDVVVFCC